MDEELISPTGFENASHRQQRKGSESRPGSMEILSRIDPAHVESGAQSDPPATVPPTGATSKEVNRNSFSQTATPISSPPGGSQQDPLYQDISRREANLHHQYARLALEKQRFRLWMQEMEYELNQRLHQLEKREQRVKNPDPFILPHKTDNRIPLCFTDTKRT